MLTYCISIGDSEIVVDLHPDLYVFVAHITGPGCDTALVERSAIQTKA